MINTLTKALAGIQDLMFGTGTVSQTRNSTVYNINRIQIAKPVADKTTLIALDVTDENNFYPYVQTFGGTTEGDGHGGLWWWDVTEPIVSDNGIDIIAGNGATIGCYKLVKMPTATTAQFEAVADPINTANKYASKFVWNTTTLALVYATGSTANSVWKEVQPSGALTYTPV